MRHCALASSYRCCRMSTAHNYPLKWMTHQLITHIESFNLSIRKSFGLIESNFIIIIIIIICIVLGSWIVRSLAPKWCVRACVRASAIMHSLNKLLNWYRTRIISNFEWHRPWIVLMSKRCVHANALDLFQIHFDAYHLNGIRGGMNDMTYSCVCVDTKLFNNALECDAIMWFHMLKLFEYERFVCVT